MSVKYSILICTIGEDIGRLKKCIDSAQRLEATKHEIVIVHQAQEGIEDLLADLMGPRLTKYLVIREYGLSVARNYGISKCAGEYIVFIDDDGFFDGEFLQRLDRIMELTQAHGVSGVVLNEDTGKPIGRTIRNMGISSLGWEDYNQWMSSATVVSREKLILAGMYDIDFGVGGLKYRGSEDTDLFFRLLSKECRLFASNQLIVFHPGSRKLASARLIDAFRKGFDYGVGRTAVFRKGAFYLQRRWFFFCAWQYSIALSAVGIIHSLIRLDIHQFIMDAGSMIGRVWGYLIYDAKRA